MLPAGRGEATELEINLTRRSVDQRPERHDPAAADAVDQPLDEPAVKAADQVRTDLGQLAERAMSERDGRPVTVVGDRRVEADGGQLGGQRIETRSFPSARPRRRHDLGHGRPPSPRPRRHPKRRRCGAAGGRGEGTTAVRARARARRRRPSTDAGGDRRHRGRPCESRADRPRACARDEAGPCSDADRGCRRSQPSTTEAANEPARGRWRTACCRRGP